METGDSSTAPPSPLSIVLANGGKERSPINYLIVVTPERLSNVSKRNRVVRETAVAQPSKVRRELSRKAISIRQNIISVVFYLSFSYNLSAGSKYRTLDCQSNLEPVLTSGQPPACQRLDRTVSSVIESKRQELEVSESD